MKTVTRYAVSTGHGYMAKIEAGGLPFSSAVLTYSPDIDNARLFDNRREPQSIADNCIAIRLNPKVVVVEIKTERRKIEV